MRLTQWEEERLLIFTAAELARRHRASGLLLNAPEAIALMCDAMLEAARAGAGYDDTVAAGRAAVSPSDVMDGVRELVDEVRLEVLLGDGTRLVVLVDPLGADGQSSASARDGALSREPMRPGEVRLAGIRPDAARRARGTVRVTNTGRHAIRVSSHIPLERLNSRLLFDGERPAGYRLDVPTGSTLRLAPGESRELAVIAVRPHAAAESAAETPTGEEDAR